MCPNSEEFYKAKLINTTESTNLKEAEGPLEVIPEAPETAEEEGDSTTTASTDQDSPLNNLIQLEDDHDI